MRHASHVIASTFCFNASVQLNSFSFNTFLVKTAGIIAKFKYVTNYHYAKA